MDVIETKCMKVIRQVHRSPAPLTEREPVALTIGNFDGLHRGHFALLDQVRQVAHKAGMRSALMSFSPSPTQFFSGPERAKPVILPWHERWALIREAGIDEVYMLRFDEQLALCTATEFFESVVCERVNARHIIVGDDFHFGYRREGTPAWLRKHAPAKGVSVTFVPAHMESGRRISSTWIREVLKTGDVEMARRLLGRPYGIRARVRQGHQRGRTWGFPTANLLPSRPPLVRGVFAVAMRIPGVRDAVPGIANVGSRPTLNEPHPPISVEVHLLEGFDWNLYGLRVQVDFLARCRDEQRFESFDALRHQIGADVAWAREYFNHQK